MFHVKHLLIDKNNYSMFHVKHYKQNGCETMAIYNSPIFNIDTKETRRYAGLQKAEFSDAHIEAACTAAQLLIKPRGTWQIYDYDPIHQIVAAPTPLLLKGSSIGKHLIDCEKVIILAATVGEAIEKEVTQSFEKGKYSFSLLLDAAATTAIEQVADAMEKTISDTVKRQGYQMKWRFSPGYGDWPIEQQPDILDLSLGQQINIHLTEALMLVPRKSITAIIGLYRPDNTCPNATKRSHDCSSCPKTDCLARKKD